MAAFDDVLNSELVRRERFLWKGRPRQGLLFRSTDIYAIPFSLLWGGFAVFWEYSVLVNARGPANFFALWGIPFVFVGLYMVVGRFFADRYQRSRTYYGVTTSGSLFLPGSWIGT